MRRLLEGRGGLVLVFVLGLAIATAATAGASSLVTGRQVKDGSIGVKDLTPTVRKQLKAAGPRGRQGVQGIQGTQGPKGDPGPLTTTLPAGQTLRGAVNLDAEGDAGASMGQALSFGLSLRAAPSLVILPPAAPATGQCPGGVGNPQAAPGVLCVYLDGTFNLETLPDFPTGLRVLDVPSGDPGASAFGAQVYIFAAAAGRFYASGSWAVTGN